jgi:phosphate-selective porin OprO/OprP
VADGKRFRITPQANYYIGSLGVLAEYVRLTQDVALYTGGSPAGGGAAQAFVINPGTKRTLNHDAWQIAASYLITGEDASFKGVKPKRDFDLDKGGWGAWELVARYHELNLDPDTFRNKAGTSYSSNIYADLSKSVKSAHSYDLGVNWYLNQDVKVALNYLHTTFDGGDIVKGQTSIDAAGTRVRDREDENAVFARFQIAY